MLIQNQWYEQEACARDSFQFNSLFLKCALAEGALKRNVSYFLSVVSARSLVGKLKEVFD